MKTKHYLLIFILFFFFQSHGFGLALMRYIDKTFLQAAQSGTQESNSMDTACSICLDDCTPRQQYTLVCNHNFHPACIIKWAFLSKNCPTCRHPIQLQRAAGKTLQEIYAREKALERANQQLQAEIARARRQEPDEREARSMRQKELNSMRQTIWEQENNHAKREQYLIRRFYKKLFITGVGSAAITYIICRLGWENQKNYYDEDEFLL